jgi:hypothetical protein
MRLIAESPQISVKARLRAAKRLEDADGIACVQRFGAQTVGSGKSAVAHESRDSDIAGSQAAEEDDRTFGERQR